MDYHIHSFVYAREKHYRMNIAKEMPLKHIINWFKLLIDHHNNEITFK
jgi:hypothetical protein